MIIKEPTVCKLAAKAVRGSITIGAVLLLAGTPTLMIGGNKAGETEVEATPSDQKVSAFTLPKTLKEGRDPFFPTSTRVMAMNRPVETKAPGPADLELKGISGTPERPLAIINNRTLAVGEEQDVSTPQGRVKVMCLAIEGTTVRVRAQGQTRQLIMRKGL